jgi:hypothetical protein
MKKNSIYFVMILSIVLMSQQGYCTSNTPAPIPTSSSSPASSQAAIVACADKERGDACAFTNDKGDSVDGKCGYIGSDQSKLVCVAYQ